MIDDRLHRVRDERDRALREHLVEALDVVRHARHQAADRDAVEERRALREHVIEDRDAQAVHRALAGELEEPLLAERRDVLRDDEPDVQPARRRQRARVAARGCGAVSAYMNRYGCASSNAIVISMNTTHAPSSVQCGRTYFHSRPDQREVVGLAEDRLGLEAGVLRRCDAHGHYTASCDDLELALELRAIELAVAAAVRDQLSCVPRSTILPCRAR